VNLTLKISMPLALALTGASLASGQTMTAEIYGQTGAPGGDRFYASDSLVATPAHQKLSLSGIAQGTNSNAWSHTEVTPKSIRATSYVHLADQTEGDSYPWFADANSVTTLSDKITVHSKDAWGGDGTMKVKMRVSGIASSACWSNSPNYIWDAAESEYFFSFEAKPDFMPKTTFYRHEYNTSRISTDNDGTHEYMNDHGGFTNPEEFIGKDVIELTMPFGFNSSFDLNIRLRTSANVTGTVGYAGADFGGGSLDLGFGPGPGFEWLGISEVRDSMGNLVNDYSITGASGVDYATGAQPAPEPATMAALGVGVIAMRRRRKAR
jgi:hypothetical protein